MLYAVIDERNALMLDIYRIAALAWLLFDAWHGCDYIFRAYLYLVWLFTDLFSNTLNPRSLGPRE
ncbi:hypothetical protein MA13_contig00013-0060 [Edwardsiella piscicida]|uniref:Uncharacterized protein n=1 Tax=Edwardsiella anguillarum ET080813 TaxID=667120 RepID=A0A076LNF9_9GAMM|nr:Hypothetical protein ETEE_3660 [Edwardsiella anguillarum ET080813]GAJ68785.1 hypothetical protein MA13_contig00013-0060 [Edwardsiella piscicida]